MGRKILLLVPLFLPSLYAQENDSSQKAILQKILQRLDALEQQNRELAGEVHSLRQELGKSRDTPAEVAAAPAQNTAAAAEGTVAPTGATAANEQASVEDRVSVNEQRIAEQAQTKVEASQKLPIALTGMLLFNAFSTSASPRNSTYDSLLYGPSNSGATLRQTQLGLRFQGPSLPGDGRVHGLLSMDFFSGSSYPSESWLRIRRGILSFDWDQRSVTFGQDKPLIAPRQPNSLAEVGIPPLSGAGNFWLWLPQARYEERHHLGLHSGWVAQAAVTQTSETYAYIPAEYRESLARVRPSFEGRVQFWHKFDDVRRFEVAPSFHLSTSHVAGTSVPSRIASLDWLVVPWSKLEFTGTVFHGQNAANLGGLSQGFIIDDDGQVRPIHSSGGWAQLSVPVTGRLTFNLFSGMENDRARDLLPGGITRNFAYASNVMYHVGPNVIIGLEALQMRTRVTSGTEQVRNRYDLALAYLF